MRSAFLVYFLTGVGGVEFGVGGASPINSFFLTNESTFSPSGLYKRGEPGLESKT